jgi:hypothetical protein
MKTKIVSCHTADSKPVKPEVNGTLILSPLVISDRPHSAPLRFVKAHAHNCENHPKLSYWVLKNRKIILLFKKPAGLAGFSSRLTFRRVEMQRRVSNRVLTRFSPTCKPILTCRRGVMERRVSHRVFLVDDGPHLTVETRVVFCQQDVQTVVVSEIKEWGWVMYVGALWYKESIW